MGELLSSPFPLLKLPPRRLPSISPSVVVFPCSIRSPSYKSASSGSNLKCLGALSVKSQEKWPEWEKMVENLGGSKGEEDLFDGLVEIPGDFYEAARACLMFARERPDLLRSLPKGDIDILVENSSPYLFKTGQKSIQRMKAFVEYNAINDLETQPAYTVDLMKYLLTCVYDHYHRCNGEGERNLRILVESSARNLLQELTKFDESKRLAGSRRKLTGREWECPQCEFFNHSRNASCLRCDFWRPENEPTKNNISPIRNVEESKETSESEISRKLDRILGRLSSPAADTSADAISGESAGVSPEKDIEGFPEIMPMRKGENRFVVSKKKDRSLTSPQYKRRAAMDQSASSNFVPFVPFPPGFFAKVEDKNDSTDAAAAAAAAADDDCKGNIDKITEVDQKDMSEEAKAERWFKRVAQINDISELSNIPDEDFPEIMPMRKGVNRFVVSKRKSPLERRLTSPQYKRNLTQENSSPLYPFSDEEQ